MKLFMLVVCATIIFGDGVRAYAPIKCTAENEEYQCGSACQTECATLGQPCPIVNIRCNDACYCIDDYARNSEGKCIPIQECNN